MSFVLQKKTLNHIQWKKVQFFELNFKISSFVWVKLQKKGSILWVIFNKKVQFLWVISKKFSSLSHKKGSITWVILKKSWVLEVIRKKVQFDDFYSKKSIFWVIFKEQYLWVLLKKEFNSESVITKKKKTGSILRVIIKKGWNSSSNVQKKRFIFESHLKTTVLSVIFLKNLWVIPKKHQFLESCSKKKGWILWVIFFWRVNMLWVVILV